MVFLDQTSDLRGDFLPFPSHHEKLAKLLQKTLKPDQAKRLQQIEFQLQGTAFAIHNPKIAVELKITDEQKKKAMTVMQGMQEKMQALGQGNRERRQFPRRTGRLE